MTTKSKIIWALFTVLFIITIIIGLGIYKFNFTDDDIYFSGNPQIEKLDEIPVKEIENVKDISEIKKPEVRVNTEDPLSSKVSLGLHPWLWVKTIYNDNKEIKNSSPEKFSVTFKNDMTFSASTDCNGAGGEYVISDNKISFKNMRSTMMYCEGSQEQSFTKMLTEAQSYSFTSKGELILKSANSSSVFK